MMKLNQFFPPRSPGSPSRNNKKKGCNGQDVFHHGDGNGGSSAPASPLVKTTDGRTVVRLFVEILSCDSLGPDFSNDGKRITKTYQPYVKVKLGGNDDSTSLDIHKTLPVTQRFQTRDPVFDHESHHSAFCIDGMEVDELSKGLMFKVKDAGTISKPSLQKDALGWALVHPDSLLWEAGMADSASNLYHSDLDHTLEFELVHPTELVTGMAGKIHLLCRPASDSDVEECRQNGWGYFKSYTRDDRATSELHALDRASTPPLLEAMQEEEIPAKVFKPAVGAELL